MQLVAKLDDYGKPAWIAVMVLGFILFWPIGLGILFYMLWSGRMGCWKDGGAGRWHNERKRYRDGFKKWRHGRNSEPATSSAFEDYREQTLRRLEEEEREFHDYLERLRRAKDKEEFDQFMEELKNRPPRTDDDTPSTDETSDRPSGGGSPQPQA